jgi:hypothetical protein
MAACLLDEWGAGRGPPARADNGAIVVDGYSKAAAAGNRGMGAALCV